MTRFYNHKSHTLRRRALRRNLPQPEHVVWSKLKNRQIHGIKFRRQYGVGPYVVDFIAPQIRLGIEIDGDSHFYGNAPAYDQKREQFIAANGIRILRFTNTDVRENIDGVIERISVVVKDLSTPS